MGFVVPEDKTVTGGEDEPMKTTEKQRFCHLLEKGAIKNSMKLCSVLFLFVFSSFYLLRLFVWLFS